jgi:MSHA pilin protein MshC
VLARSVQVSSERGFTLIELISCIVIIGILAAVSGPKFFSEQTFQERGYIDEIAASLRNAQQVAIASGCEVSFTVNATGYQAMQRAAAGTTCATAGAFVTTVKRLDGTAMSAPPPANVSSNPAIQIIFDAKGRVANGAPAPLQVGGYTLTVVVGSGFVQVQ